MSRESTPVLLRPLKWKPGDVVRYTPKSWHCRHGIAVIDEHGTARDTYWSSGEYSAVWSEHLQDAELMFRMGDYRQTRDRAEWEKYAEADRQMFPMGGVSERLFIRIDAQPDLETQIQNAYKRLREAEEELKSAGRKIEWAGRDIALLEAQRNG